ncbi:MAG TPA: undecaprenyl-phosphate glucose phosphotransferase [Candidatus Omnitrophota bacterium]|nr:undecaprenyl-phosphate glucose phosphotransferase [Candidatus Omnitrophota bacterium]HPS19558.1 undecaprenyl-phosphate glucose phosphotransferase [Candidatus Omnitrophota bacterium]
MRIRNDVRLGLILMLGDMLAINAGFLLSYWVRFNSGLFKITYGVPHIHAYLEALPILTLIFIFIMRFEHLYAIRVRLSIVDEFFLIMKADTLSILLFMAGTFVYREYSFSRGMLLICWIVLLVSLGLWRFAVNRARFVARNRYIGKRRLIVVGNGEMACRLVRHITGDAHWNYEVVGIVKINGNGNSLSECGVPVLGDFKDMVRILDSVSANEMILTESEIPRDEIMNIIFECEKRMIEFRLVADILGMITSEVDMWTIDGIPLLGLKETPLAEEYNRFIKRTVDIVVSVGFICFFMPVFIVLAFLIKISSPGPVFYMQKRVGEDGKRFTMIKFRTMINNAEKGTGPVWTKENDPRRTAIGCFLRTSNLDELPQLFNVLRGDMSLVGPRPERPHFVGQFKENVPRYMARHKIKSGMTGWAQVNGLRGDTSIEERTKYDLYYIENWSIWFDFKIMFMSAFALKNAY